MLSNETKHNFVTCTVEKWEQIEVWSYPAPRRIKLQCSALWQKKGLFKYFSFIIEFFILLKKTRPDTQPIDATSGGRLLYLGLMFNPNYLTLCLNLIIYLMFKPYFLTLCLNIMFEPNFWNFMFKPYFFYLIFKPNF